MSEYTFGQMNFENAADLEKGYALGDLQLEAEEFLKRDEAFRIDAFNNWLHEGKDTPAKDGENTLEDLWKYQAQVEAERPSAKRDTRVRQPEPFEAEPEYELRPSAIRPVAKLTFLEGIAEAVTLSPAYKERYLAAENASGSYAVKSPEQLKEIIDDAQAKQLDIPVRLAKEELQSRLDNQLVIQAVKEAELAQAERAQAEAEEAISRALYEAARARQEAEAKAAAEEVARLETERLYGVLGILNEAPTLDENVEEVPIVDFTEPEKAPEVVIVAAETPAIANETQEEQAEQVEAIPVSKELVAQELEVVDAPTESDGPAKQEATDQTSESRKKFHQKLKDARHKRSEGRKEASEKRRAQREEKKQARRERATPIIDLVTDVTRANSNSTLRYGAAIGLATGAMGPVAAAVPAHEVTSSNLVPGKTLKVKVNDLNDRRKARKEAKREEKAQATERASRGDIRIAEERKDWDLYSVTPYSGAHEKILEIGSSHEDEEEGDTHEPTPGLSQTRVRRNGGGGSGLRPVSRQPRRR